MSDHHADCRTSCDRPRKLTYLRYSLSALQQLVAEDRVSLTPKIIVQATAPDVAGRWKQRYAHLDHGLVTASPGSGTHEYSDEHSLHDL